MQNQIKHWPDDTVLPSNKRSVMADRETVKRYFGADAAFEAETLPRGTAVVISQGLRAPVFLLRDAIGVLWITGSLEDLALAIPNVAEKTAREVAKRLGHW